MSGAKAGGRVVSVRVGRVESHTTSVVSEGDERVWRTAYFKHAVNGPVRLGRLGLEGDEQYDRRDHGGPDRAALAYSADHYPRWQAELRLESMEFGGFGENLTLADLDESNVCVGDTWAIGDARVQVASPRGPCANISRRWNRPQLLKRVVETLRFGWYLRVLEEAPVAAGLPVTLIERPYPDWSVAQVFRLKLEPGLDLDAVAKLAVCPELAPGWREKFSQRLVDIARRED